MTEITKQQKPSITFLDLLQAYDGDIWKAKKSELKKVKQSGLKNLFMAYREHRHLEIHKQKCPLFKRANC